MKIVQLTDLHLNGEEKLDAHAQLFEQLVLNIKEHVSRDEEIVILVCGDIGNKGSLKGVENAEHLFELLKNGLSGYNVYFEFVPGNHDLVEDSFWVFDSLATKFSDYRVNFTDESIVEREYYDCNLVLINSVYHKDYKYGKIDFENYQKIGKSSKCRVAVMHHALLSRYCDDFSSIRDAYRFISSLEDVNVKAIIHGHVHAYSEMSVGNGCQVISVGSFFSNQQDVNSQFNIIDVRSGNLNYVINFAYRKDLGKYTDHIVFERGQRGVFEGRSIRKVYQEVVKSTMASGAIHNLYMQVKQNFGEFGREVREDFVDEMKMAKDWIAQDVPENLHYNHGSIFNKENAGVKYVVKELSQKTTSSRAVLSLLEPCSAYASEDDFLPSLNIVQFGFADEKRDELHVTIYLRALEVSKFLKINICEALMLAESVRDKIRSIENVCVSVFTFRAQCKEGFGCFSKAYIDKEPEAALSRMICKGDFELLVEKLEEKLALKETVVVTDGFIKLRTAIETNKEDFDMALVDSVLKRIDDVVECMARLKEVRATSSLHHVALEAEEDLSQEIQRVIDDFKMLGGL